MSFSGRDIPKQNTEHIFFHQQDIYFFNLQRCGTKGQTPLDRWRVDTGEHDAHRK